MNEHRKYTASLRLTLGMSKSLKTFLHLQTRIFFFLLFMLHTSTLSLKAYKETNISENAVAVTCWVDCGNALYQFPILFTSFPPFNVNSTFQNNLTWLEMSGVFQMLSLYEEWQVLRSFVHFIIGLLFSNTTYTTLFIGILISLHNLCPKRLLIFAVCSF